MLAVTMTDLGKQGTRVELFNMKVSYSYALVSEKNKMQAHLTSELKLGPHPCVKEK